MSASYDNKLQPLRLRRRLWTYLFQGSEPLRRSTTLAAYHPTTSPTLKPCVEYVSSEMLTLHIIPHQSPTQLPQHLLHPTKKNSPNTYSSYSNYPNSSFPTLHLPSTSQPSTSPTPTLTHPTLQSTNTSSHSIFLPHEEEIFLPFRSVHQKPCDSVSFVLIYNKCGHWTRGIMPHAESFAAHANCASESINCAKFSF